MAIQLPVYVIGFGDVYREFFNAIAATVGSHDYGALIKLMLLCGGVWTLVTGSLKNNHTLNIRWAIMYVVLTSVVLVPNCQVIINDRTSDHAYSVDNIPLGLGILASFTSRVGTGFTELVESVFHTPNDLDYTHSGMLMGSKMIEASSHFQVVGGNFQRNLQGFVQQCIFYDVLLHKYTIEDLSNAPNLWQFVTSHASPARAFMYNNTVTTCAQGAGKLSHDWQTAIDNSANSYADLLFPNNTNAKAQMLSYLGTSYQYLANVSDDAASIMQQNMMIQAIQDGVGVWASGINAQTALNDFAFAKAQQQKRTGYGLLFRLAVYWLPLTKAVMELILLGSFLIIVLFLFFPFGTSIFKNYVMAFLWLQLWAPLFAFENFIFTFVGSHLLSSSTHLIGATHGITLTTYSALQQINADLGYVAGFLAAATPIIAAGIFRDMMSVFVQASSYLGGAMQSAAFAAAGEAVTGNVSLGNTHFNDHSAYNTNANHFDTNPRVASGMMSYQLAGGGTSSIAADGSVILSSHSAISQLPVSPYLAQSLQQSFSTMAGTAESSAMRYAHSSQDSYSSALRNLYELGSTQSHSSSSGLSSSLSSSGNFSTAAREAHQLIDRFAEENHLSYNHATQMLGAAYANANIHGSFESKRELAGKIASYITGANIGGSVQGGVRGEASFSHGHNASALLNKAESFSEEHHFGETVERAMRAAHEENFRTGSESSDRLGRSMASSFDASQTSAKQASSSFDESQNYSQQASLVENQSVGINAQATQEYSTWLMQQPSIQHHGGGMGAQEIMTMMQQHPEIAENYAKEFVHEKETAYIKSFAAQHPGSRIAETYQANNAVVGSESTIQAAQNSNDQVISNSATQHDTGTVDNSVVAKTNNAIDAARHTSDAAITEKGDRMINTVEKTQAKNGVDYQ